MHDQRTTSLLDRPPEAATARPLAIGAESPPVWFETDGKPFRVLIDLPLSFDDMVAALYGPEDSFLSAADLAADEHVRGLVALAVVEDGMRAVERRAAVVRASEVGGIVAAPEWLALCRRRVADVFCPARGNGLSR